MAAPVDTIIYPLPSILDRIDLAEVFPAKQPLEVELGSGDGSFLVGYASAHLELNFLGIERLLGRLGKLERKARRAGLRNVRGIRIESAYFLEFLLPRHCARALHVYFPDPWPKRKHRRHRLINERFPALAHAALEPGGAIYLRTDDPEYFAQMRSVFDSELFEPADTPPGLVSRLTDFERDFQTRGIEILRAAYRSAA